jgi:hypothetical protein
MIRIGHITKPYRAWNGKQFVDLDVKKEVYEFLGHVNNTDEQRDCVAITLTPNTLPYMIVPQENLRWNGVCDHFDNIKAQLERS